MKPVLNNQNNSIKIKIKNTNKNRKYDKKTGIARKRNKYNLFALQAIRTKKNKICRELTKNVNRKKFFGSSVTKVL